MWLILLIPLAWQLGFQSGTDEFRPSRKNPCTIVWEQSGALNTRGALRIKGDAEARGRLSAWIPVQGIDPISKNSTLSFWVKGKGKPMRVRIIFRPEGGADYFHLWQSIDVGTLWRKVEIPLDRAIPLWSSNYPYVLTPGRKPDLFIFFENWERGEFDVTIDEILLEEGGSK